MVQMTRGKMWMLEDHRVHRERGGSKYERARAATAPRRVVLLRKRNQQHQKLKR
jgi:hypothetical protein